MIVKLSHWFDFNEKPVRVGAYQTLYPFFLSPAMYAWWNGKRWGPYAETPEKAYKVRNGCISDQNKTWRGIVK